MLALAASQGVGVVLDLHKRLQRSPLWGQHSVGEQVGAEVALHPHCVFGGGRVAEWWGPVQRQRKPDAMCAPCMHAQVLQIFSDMLAGGRGGEGGCCRESSEEEEEQQEEKGGTACLEEGADNEQESALREGKSQGG